MVCTPNFLWGQIREEAYKQRVTGKEGTFRDRKVTRVSYSECRALVARFSTRAQYGARTWYNTAVYTGSRCGRGRTYHICGVLPQDYEVGGVTSTGMPRNSPQLRSDVGKFHVQTFSLGSCGAAGGEGGAALI